ncbi:hypothetical protein NXC24_CH01648 [Rhizobium sp. NXC24]|nr:hypothetical protein NXC24_CH01648 [Rhizobium sp. NXC24]
MADYCSVLQRFIEAKGLNSIRNNYAHRTAEALAADHSHELCTLIRRSTREQIDNIRQILEAYN